MTNRALFQEKKKHEWQGNSPKVSMMYRGFIRMTFDFKC